MSTPVNHQSIDFINHPCMYIVYDTETTGLKPLNDVRMVEIHLTRFYAPYHRFNSLIQADRDCEPGAERIHGITKAMLQLAPTFETIEPELTNFLTHSIPVILIAHNGENYDHILLRDAYTRIGKSLPSNVYFADSLPAFQLSCSTICTSTGASIPMFNHRVLGHSVLSRIYQVLVSETQRLQNSDLLSHRAQGDAQMLVLSIRALDTCQRFQFFQHIHKQCKLGNISIIM